MRVETRRTLLSSVVVILAMLAALWRAGGVAHAATITNLADSGPGSLREAMATASSGDTIDLTALSGVMTLTSGELFIDKDLTINGPGPATLSIDGNGSSRIFSVVSGVTASISGLTITNGSNSIAGGILNNGGTFTITNTTVSGNATTSGFGGGISNSSGTMTITSSTVSGNSASRGAGISNTGTLIMSNSTVSGNSSVTGGGGGIWNQSGTLTMSNSTVSGNSLSASNGGGIFNFAGTVTLSNTIIAENTASGGPDCVGSPTSLGYNLIGDDTGCGFSATTGDLVGTGATPINPLLGPLQDNGGPTKTHELLTGSPAIDAGDDAVAPATDQRGIARVPQSDIGAFEVEIVVPEADLSVTKASSPDPVAVGSNVTYTITVTNNGPSSASDAVVTDTLPGGVTFVSSDATQGSCGGTTTVTCDLGTLNNGASATVTIVATRTGSGALSNTASVTTSTTDPVGANDSATNTLSALVTSVPSLSQWRLIIMAVLDSGIQVDGLLVRLTPTTKVEGSLSVGAMVKVEAVMEGGVLVAIEIEVGSRHEADKGDDPDEEDEEDGD